MKISRILFAGALPLVCMAPAMAQNTYPTQAAGVRAGGTVMMMCDAGGVNCRPVTSANPLPIDAGSGATASQTQGTAANGAAPVGNPNLVAGSDGTNVRTILTNQTGGLRIGITSTSVAAGGTNVTDGIVTGGASLDTRSLGYLFNGTSLDRQRTATGADATTGTGLLGAGILGQYQTTLPTYTTGQFGTLAMSGSGVMLNTLTTAAGTAIQAGSPQDATPGATSLRVWSFPMMYNGTAYDRVRGDTTSGLYMVSKGGGNIATGQISVSTTAVLIAATRAGRQKIIVSVGAANSCAVGNAGVTLTTGFPLQPVAGATITLDTNAALYAICSAATTISDVELY